MTTTTAEYSSSAELSVPIRLQAWLWPAATVAVLGIAYGRLLVEFCVSLWERSHYQYFPFVIAAFLYLLWRNGSAAQPRQAAGWQFQYGPTLLLVAAWLLLARAYMLNSPWLAIVSAIMLIGSRLLRFSANWNVKYLFGIWAMLWLIVPLPLNRDQDLIVGLQHLSSRLSSIFLDAAGVDHLMEGNTLLLPSKQLFVDEACSGIVSVLSVIACAVIYGAWRNRSFVHVICLALAGVGWATFMNVIRITVIALLIDKAGIDWSTGTPHEVLSLVIFSFILLGLVSTDMLLLGLLLPIGPTWEQIVAAQAHFGESVVRWFDRLIANHDESTEVGDQPPHKTWSTPFSTSRMTLRLLPLAAFTLLAALQFTSFARNANDRVARTSDSQRYIQRAQACTAETLPPNVGALQRIQFFAETRDRENVLGMYSRTYEYRDTSEAHYVASCDFPYSTGWHELTLCYRGQGWQLKDRRIETEKSGTGDGEWQYMRAEFTKPDGSYGYLMASAFDEAGQHLDLPTKSLVDDAFSALSSRGKANVKGLTFQVQVWTTAARPIGQHERDAARQLLLAARQRFYNHIAMTDSPPQGPAVTAP